MTELGITWEQEILGGGRYQLIKYLAPIAYNDNGILRRIVPDWTDSGISERPHLVAASRIMCSVGDDGMRRIHPTREIDRYMEIGAPYAKVGGVWRKVSFTNTVRTRNMLAWTRPEANLAIVHAGHYVKLDIELKGGYIPEDGMIAFPVGLVGLTRNGGQILADGVPVVKLRAPVAYDADNERDVRPVDWKFVTLNSQPYLLLTLPSLTGMTRPVVDPTLVLDEGEVGADIDTWIRSSDPTAGHDGGSYIYVGGHDDNGVVRGLMKFDLSSIPSTATIDSATVSLYYYYSVSTDQTISLYRVLRAWVEAQATWNSYSTGNSWAVAGAGDASDAETTALGSASFLHAGTDAWVDIALSTTLVQEWVNGTLTNNGFLAKGSIETTSTSKAVRSSDYSTASLCPKITVVYTEASGGSIIPHVMHYAQTRRAR